MKNINELIREYKKGNKDVFEQIEEMEKKQIYNIIKNFSKYNLEDLYSIGIIGLLKAIDLFEEDKNVKFNTFAFYCIKNEVFMELRKSRKYADNVAMSINEDVNDTDECSLSNVLKSDENIEEDIIQNEKILWLYSIIKEFGRKNQMKTDIMLEIIKEKKQKDIAEKFGVSRGYVAKLQNEFIKFGKEKAEKIA
jgi:RNA polymerase sporulation-specific sigma factor